MVENASSESWSVYTRELANSSFGERQSTHRIARFRRPESMEPPGRRSVAALYSQ